MTMPDPDRLTAELAAIRGREQAAIAGPWEIVYDSDDGDEVAPMETFPAALRLPEPQQYELPDGSMSVVYDTSYEYCDIAELPEPTVKFIVAARSDVPRLLAVVEALLAPHKPGRVAITGRLCASHKVYRDFSVDRDEAAALRACPDCTATVYSACAGCGEHQDFGSCPARAAAAGELLSKEKAGA